MDKRGRPIKYTPERLDYIIENISAGVPYELAAEAAGICEDTLYDWINKGKKFRDAGIDHPLAIFSESIKRKEIDKLRKILTNVESADKNWQASAWLLERRWWKYYSSHAPLIELNKRLDAMENLKVNEPMEITQENPI